MLDTAFQNWVFHPDAASCAYWERFLDDHPEKRPQIEEARLLLIHLTREVPTIGEDLVETNWSAISAKIDNDSDSLRARTVPIRSSVGFRDRDIYTGYIPWYRRQGYRTLVILAIVFVGAWILGPKDLEQGTFPEQVSQMTYEVREAPPGLKTSFRLADGSHVTLNSGSKLSYLKEFAPDKRELFLEGEAYFEVAKDSLRPFVVHTDRISTKALGTSFNIKAFPHENQAISLITGSVMVELQGDETPGLLLTPGKGVVMDAESGAVRETPFEASYVLAWTQKTIHFEDTPISEVIRTLENWYGINISVKSKPSPLMKVSGVFRNQSIEGVLEGLSYSARFEYTIEQNQIKLNFR